MWRLSAALLSVIAAATPALHAQARTWVVDAGGGGDFKDLAPALAAARDGDTIRVRAGTYNGGTTGKALTILGDTGARILLPSTGGAALRIDGLPRDKTFVVEGLTGLRPTGLFPGVSFVRIESCEGRVHCDRLSADLILPPSQAGFNSPLGVTVMVSKHVTLTRCTIRAAYAVSAFASVLAAAQCTFEGQPAVDDPRVGQRTAGPAVGSVGGPITLSHCRLQGGNGAPKYLVGGYWPPAPAVLAALSTVTVAGSDQSLLAAGAQVPIAMFAVDGSSSSLARDPRVVLRSHGGAPLVNPAIASRVVRLPSMTATGGAPGGTLQLELLATQGDLADVMLSLPAYSWTSPLPDTGEGWLDLPTLIVLGHFQVPQSEKVALTIPIPSAAGLVGLPVVAQALAGSAQKYRLSTPVTVVLD